MQLDGENASQKGAASMFQRSGGEGSRAEWAERLNGLRPIVMRRAVRKTSWAEEDLRDRVGAAT